MDAAHTFQRGDKVQFIGSDGDIYTVLHVIIDASNREEVTLEERPGRFWVRSLRHVGDRTTEGDDS